jgi:hypothetical protein
MKARTYWLALAMLAAPPAVLAASLAGPHMGMVFDPAVKGLRPILGIPGAATLGDPLKLGVELDKAVISPLQDYAVATVGEGRQVMLLPLGGSTIAPAAIQGAGAAPDRLVLSANGRAAALYYADRNHIQMLTGLPGAPKASADLILSEDQVPSALAVDDAGRTVLAGVAGTVYLVTANGEVPILTGLGNITAMTLAAGRTALIADGAKDRIYRVSDVSGPAEAIIIGRFRDGIAEPVALAVSEDGHRAFVANAKSGTVAILDLEGQRAVEKIACRCKPTGLDRLAGDGVYRLTEPSDRPIWVLEAGTHAPRVMFVPAILARSSEK